MLLVTALGGAIVLLMLVAAAIFGAAGQFGFWQGSVFLVIFGGFTLGITLYLNGTDPRLLERRVKAGPLAENERVERVGQAFAALSFLGIFVVSGVDRRFTWTTVEPATSILGDLLIAFGFVIVWRVFRENSFALGTIGVVPNQRVVSTGLYSVVRHPMYCGAIMVVCGIPIALGSLVGCVPAALVVVSIVSRILHEEDVLKQTLPGYREYCERVRNRLLPFIW